MHLNYKSSKRLKKNISKNKTNQKIIEFYFFNPQYHLLLYLYSKIYPILYENY